MHACFLNVFVSSMTSGKIQKRKRVSLKTIFFPKIPFITKVKNCHKIDSKRHPSKDRLRQLSFSLSIHAGMRASQKEREKANVLSLSLTSFLSLFQRGEFGACSFSPRHLGSLSTVGSACEPFLLSGEFPFWPRQPLLPDVGKIPIVVGN